MRSFAYRLLLGAFLAAVLAPLPLYSQDEVEGPWGTANGDIYGRARSDTIPEQFTGAPGVDIAWQFDPTASASSRPFNRSSIVFDASGNIYWHSDNARLTSIDPTGQFRWNATVSGGGAYGLGGTTSPIVGIARVYQLSTDPLIAAFDKSTGVELWTTVLPESPWNAGDQLTPILYQGKIYIVGPTDGANVNVYQVDADTGDIDWQSTVPITLNFRGTMALAPDVFGTGVHGLYFNGDSGSGSDGIPEMYGLSVDSDPVTGGATLAWGMDSGKAARSHVIYNPDAPGGPRLYIATWSDYGGTLYAHDPVTGDLVSSTGPGGHGYYDVGSLGWDDTTIIAGAFDGQVNTYTDDGTGATTIHSYQYSDGMTPTNWFGEYRSLGQLLQDDMGNPILVTGTNSQVNTYGPAYTARAVLLDLANAVENQDGPLYLDDISVQEGPDTSTLTTVMSEDFESMNLGNIAPQNGWVDDLQLPSGSSPAQVIDDPTGGGQGQIAMFDADGNGGGWQGVFHDFPDTTQDVVVIQYRQYRMDLTDNIWPYFGGSVNNFDTAWSLAWDSASPPGYFPYNFAGATVAQTTGIWQTITFTYENMNDPDPANRTVTVDVDGVSSSTTQDQGFASASTIAGFGIQLEGTAITTGGTPNTPAIDYDTGISADNSFTLPASPLIGPDGKLYYFDPSTGFLVALEAQTVPIPQFRRGDISGDGVIQINDPISLLNYLFVPGSPVPACLDAADVDDDGVLGIGDPINLLNYLFVPGSPAPPAPGPDNCGEDPTMDSLMVCDYTSC